MPAEDHRQLKRLITAFRARFTQPGTIIITTLFISADVSSQGTFISSYIFLSFLMGYFFIAVAFSYFFKPKVTAFRHQGPALNSGDTWVYKVTVQNIGNKTIRNLAVYEGLLPFGLYTKPRHKDVCNTIAWLEPGEKSDVQLAVECRQRGIYNLPPLLIGSSFPNGIVRKPIKVCQNQRLTVYPKYTSISLPLKSDIKVYQPGGISSSSHVGNSNEFFGTREFRQGDRIRDVHWASSARNRKLIVKEYLEEYFLHSGIIIDTQCSFWKKTDGYEYAISLAAGLSEAYIRQDRIVDIMLMDKTFKHFQTGRAIAPTSYMLAFLAGISEADRINFDTLAIKAESIIEHLTSLTIFLTDWDATRAKFINRIRSPNIKINIYVIKNSAPTIPLEKDITFLTPKDNIQMPL